MDFLITDAAFAPKIAVEINDPTHHEYERRKRDEKVAAICAEAGVPIVTLWTNYGVNREYMQKRITETLENPPQRVAHHAEKPAEPKPLTVTELQQTWDEHAAAHNETRKKKQGCYVATCVYGSYDCPQVWTLRRYRDDVLKIRRRGAASSAFIMRSARRWYVSLVEISRATHVANGTGPHNQPSERGRLL